MLIRNIPTPSIGEIVASQHPFYVPVYQRGYAWDLEEISDYIKDVRTLWDARRANPAQPMQHFLGGTVSVHHYVQNRVGRKHEVVDGQQRLATFTLSISVIVHSLDALHANAADLQVRQEAEAYATQLRDDYLRYSEIQGGAAVWLPKLKLSNADEPFFSEVVENRQRQPIRESHGRIDRAYQAIGNQLVQPILASQASDRAKLDDLLALKAAIATDCVVIHIVSDNRLQAYRLFSVLNDRGRSLSDGDLLRAHTLNLLDGHAVLQERAELHWNELLGADEAYIDRFLRAYYPSNTGERAPRADLFDTYRKRFFNYTHPLNPAQAADVERVVAEMARETRLFALLQEGAWPFQPATVSMWRQDRLTRLVSVLGHNLPLPLLLSATKLGEVGFSDIVMLLERFAFRYLTIAQGHANALYGIYYPEAKKIRDNPGGYVITDLQQALRARIGRSADDPTFKAGLETRLRYSKSSTDKRAIKYLLSTLESYDRWLANGGPGVPQADETQVFDLDELTIEHVYPRNAAVPDAVMEPLKDELGNLALWGPNDNRGAANDLFPAKQPLYARSNISFTRALARHAQWTKAEFDQHEREIVDAALKVFRI